MGIKGIVVWRILPTLVVAMAGTIGFFLSHEFPLAFCFVTVLPLVKGVLPPSIVGHGLMMGAPEVPDDLLPHPRPKDETFLELPGGGRLPQQGIGMCCRATATDDVMVYRTVLWYLLLGGRHIDGAHFYLNHAAIGKGIAEAIFRGVAREEIFITTKIFPTHFGYNSAKNSVQGYLKELGLGYIDMILLHWPDTPLQSPCKKEGKSKSECRRETWRALSELREQGLIKNLGVSNFALKHILEFEGFEAPIANNQISFHPFEPDHVMDTVEYCQSNNITITAYSPLGGLMDKDRAHANDFLKELSSKYGKSVSQILLRWAMQRGCAVIPGTGNPEHMKENLSIYEFNLSDEDMKSINHLKNGAKGFSHVDVRQIE